jgi:hypothetical protein
VPLFWEAMRAALPPGFWHSAEQLKNGDPTGLDTIIEFLEADPIYFRSGYLKADLLRWLNRVSLTQEQFQRLGRVVLHVVSANWRREFNRYCLLARRLDGPQFRSDLQRLSRSPRLDVRRRAERVLAVLDGKQVQWRGFIVRPLRGNLR